MKRFLIAAAFALAPALAPNLVLAQAPPEIPFEGTDALNPPADMHLGEVAGVAVNPKDGHILVFQRGNTTGPAYGAAAAQLLEFGHDGRFVREIGHNLYAWSFAHAVRVDPRGDIWVADKGSDMVIRFNPQGRVTWVFGRKPEASDENAHPLEHPKPPLPAQDGYFRQVTDMAWDSKGNTYTLVQSSTTGQYQQVFQAVGVAALATTDTITVTFAAANTQNKNLIAVATSFGCPPGVTWVGFAGAPHHKIYRTPRLASNTCKGTFVA